MIPLFKVHMPPRDVLMPALESVLYSGQISESKPVVEFEEKYARHFSVPNPISFYSGTAALHTALILAGVEPGDEVISTPVTAIPTNQAVLHAGASIAWADVDSSNGNIDPESVAKKITNKTKAIMVVHYGGIPASIRRMRQVAESHGLPVIEDAAHALGAQYGGVAIGNHSEFTMFSLQAIKHMTTVDGGMLACRKPEDAHKGKILRWFGIDRSQDQAVADIATIGFKYHMNNVNATIGNVQLDFIDAVISKHISNGKYYDEVLRDVPGVRLCSWDPEAEPSYWFYTLLVERREDFVHHLNDHGIVASQVHRRNDSYSLFSGSQCDLPGVDLYYRDMVHIPCGWWVTESDRNHIVDVIRMGW